MVTTLTISVVWIIYSMIPPYLLIHYTWIGRGTTLQFMCRVAFVLSFVTSICAMLLLWAVYPKDYDFGSATKVRLSCASVLEHLCLHAAAAGRISQGLRLQFRHKGNFFQSHNVCCDSETSSLRCKSKLTNVWGHQKCIATSWKIQLCYHALSFVCTGGVQTLTDTLVVSQLMQTIRLHIFFIVYVSNAD